MDDPCYLLEQQQPEVDLWLQREEGHWRGLDAKAERRQQVRVGDASGCGRVEDRRWTMRHGSVEEKDQDSGADQAADDAEQVGDRGRNR